MNLDELADIFRGANIVLALVLLGLLQRVNTKYGDMWTQKMRAIHRFTTLIVLTIVFGYAEKIAQDAKPAFSIFLMTPVLVFGIYATLKTHEKGYQK